jgi:UDP-2,3-diacylglucosamine pyrophosphatase LpxH
MKIACYTDVHNQQTMLQLPTVLRGSATAAVELTKKEWGEADIALIGGDNISDYPHWNKSCAFPYKNWLAIKEKMVNTFAKAAKGGRVLYVDGNNDLILGDLPTKENPPYNTCEFY